MVEILHKRLDVRRERVGLAEEGLRGANASAATVEEAVHRLREVDGRAKLFHELQMEAKGEDVEEKEGGEGKKEEGSLRGKSKFKVEAEAARLSKQRRLESIKAKAEERPLFKEGRLLHRTEPELKTHTSYLVFAVLPRAWTKEDEERCQKTWGRGVKDS